MPTRKEREYYRMGFIDGRRSGLGSPSKEEMLETIAPQRYKRKPKRKLSAWNKFVKANSKKPRFRFRNGKLKLKQMAIAFRKTPAGKKKK